MLRHLKAFAIAVAVAVTFSGTVVVNTAQAAPTPNNKITITSNEGDHTYGAYQIFSGKVKKNNTTPTDELKEINWGTGIQSANLLADNALKQAPLNAYFGAVTANTKAVEFAKMLNKALNNAAATSKFAEVVKKHLSSTKTDFTKEGDQAPFTYKTADIDEGYYIVVDKDKTPAALTSPILKVVGPVTVQSKSSVPQSDKAIVKDPNAAAAFNPTATTDVTTENNGLSEVSDVAAGEKASFVLRGTVSSNFADYEAYKYSFKDRLGKGLEFDQASVKVYIDRQLVDSSKYQITSQEIGQGDQDEAYRGGKEVTIAFANLKDPAMQPTVTANSVIIVTYDAKVTRAVDPSKPIQNQSWVVYSKDSTEEDGGTTGETPKDKVFVFNYTLKATKVDSVDHEVKLQGAKFKVANHDKTKFLKRTENPTGVFTTEWVAEGEATEYTSLADGTFKITGLDSGNFFLKETTAPEGYTLPEGDNAYFPFNIASTLTENGDGNTAEITTLSLNSVNAPVASNLEVPIEVENSSSTELPSTGGIGTTIFIITGLAIMTIAAVGLQLRRRKNN